MRILVAQLTPASIPITAWGWWGVGAGHGHPLCGHGLAQKKRAIDTEDIAERAIKQFRMAETIGRIRSGMLPVIFTPKAFILMLITLYLGLDGKNVYAGRVSPARSFGGNHCRSTR
jgi:predicted Zn-dependent protease